MGGVGTSILGRPRHLPRYRRASHRPTSDYTLNCEEPEWAASTRAGDPNELFQVLTFGFSEQFKLSCELLEQV
jgi:hypothetical protein